MMKKANGYVFKAVGKSFATEANPLAGVFMGEGSFSNYNSNLFNKRIASAKENYMKKF